MSGTENEVPGLALPPGVPVLFVGGIEAARALFCGWTVLEGQTIDMESIPELRSMLHRTPWNGEHRVFIVSGEQMNPSYWDVMLKVMEDLGTDTRFMIHTENQAAIPTTVVSRCFVRYLPYMLESHSLSIGGSKAIQSVQLFEARTLFESYRELDSAEALDDLVAWMMTWADNDTMRKAFSLVDVVRKGGRALYAVTCLALYCIPRYWEYKDAL